MKTTWVALLCVALVGCGDDGGGSNPTGDAGSSGPDAKQFLDAPPTQTVEVTVSGQATSQSAQGSQPQAGVTIEAFRKADENTPIATTVTDAQGNYSLTIQTNGESIDGFLKATKTGFKTTYLYPPYPLTMDFDNASVIMVTPDTWDTLSIIADGDQMAGNAFVALIVTDGANPVGGAKVTSNPAPTPETRYNALAGTVALPSSTAMETHTDGVAYLFNLPPGEVTVSATKTGMTFSSHDVKAWADQLTTTVIVP